MKTHKTTIDIPLTGGTYSNMENINGTLKLKSTGSAVSSSYFNPNNLSSSYKGDWTVIHGSNSSAYSLFNSSSTLIYVANSSKEPGRILMDSNGTVSKKLAKYDIYNSSDKVYYPKAWKLYGKTASNGQWVLLDSRYVEQSSWPSKSSLTFTVPPQNYVECTAWEFRDIDGFHSTYFATGWNRVNLYEVTENFASSGYYISPTIDAGDLISAMELGRVETLNSNTTTREISTSEDGVNFTDFTPMSATNVTKTKYFKIKYSVTRGSANNSALLTHLYMNITKTDIFLVKDGDKYKTYANGVWTEVSPGESYPSIAEFEKHGMKDIALITKESMKGLEDDDISIIVLSSSAQQIGSRIYQSSLTIYDSVNKNYKGIGVVQTELEELPLTRKQLIINADHVGCTFQYSLDAGSTWRDIIPTEVKDITDLEGNELIIQVSLPTTSATLSALSYAWV